MRPINYYPEYPRFVEERLKYTMCHICPLNGQRKVGHDGPADADIYGIYEAPGADEEEDRITKGHKYGRPLQGKTGYFTRVRHLAPVGLQELHPPAPGRTAPRLGKMHIHLLNVAMCRPPKNKIDSPEGKKAVRCCANSARWFLNERLRENPHRTLAPAGGTALSMLRGVKTPIEPYRGRFMVKGDESFPYEDENEIMKYVLRGVKPKEEWWEAFEAWIKAFVKFYRATSRYVERQAEKDAEAAVLSSNGWLTDWTKLWKKQKAARTRQLKKEKQANEQVAV